MRFWPSWRLWRHEWMCALIILDYLSDRSTGVRMAGRLGIHEGGQGVWGRKDAKMDFSGGVKGGFLVGERAAAWRNFSTASCFSCAHLRPAAKKHFLVPRTLNWLLSSAKHPQPLVENECAQKICRSPRRAPPTSRTLCRSCRAKMTKIALLTRIWAVSAKLQHYIPSANFWLV